MNLALLFVSLLLPLMGPAQPPAPKSVVGRWTPNDWHRRWLTNLLEADLVALPKTGCGDLPLLRGRPTGQDPAKLFAELEALASPKNRCAKTALENARDLYGGGSPEASARALKETGEACKNEALLIQKMAALTDRCSGIQATLTSPLGSSFFGALMVGVGARIKYLGKTGKYREASELALDLGAFSQNLANWVTEIQPVRFAVETWASFGLKTISTMLAERRLSGEQRQRLSREVEVLVSREPQLYPALVRNTFGLQLRTLLPVVSGKTFPEPPKDPGPPPPGRTPATGFSNDPGKQGPVGPPRASDTVFTYLLSRQIAKQIVQACQGGEEGACLQALGEYQARAEVIKTGPFKTLWLLRAVSVLGPVGGFIHFATDLQLFRFPMVPEARRMQERRVNLTFLQFHLAVLAYEDRAGNLPAAGDFSSDGFKPFRWNPAFGNELTFEMVGADCRLMANPPEPDGRPAGLALFDYTLPLPRPGRADQAPSKP